MRRSKVRRAVRSNVSQDLMSRVRSRVAKRTSIGVTMRGTTVMADEVACQRICSEREGYLKFQPMQCRLPNMAPIRDQRSLFVTEV